MITEALVKRCCQAVAKVNGNKQPGAWKTYRHTVQTTLAIMEVAFSHMASDEAEEAEPDPEREEWPHYGVPDSFENDLVVLLNRHAMVPPNGMPDYVLAEYLSNCLANLNTAIFSQQAVSRKMTADLEEKPVT